MIIENLIRAEFEFLVSIEGFSIERNGDCEFKFTKGSVVLETSYNERDDFDAYLVALSKDKISLGIVVDAVKTHEGTYVDLVNEEPSLSLTKNRVVEIARFLRSYPKLLEGNIELLKALENLRFWHCGQWVKKWGKGIKMTSDQIAANRLVVPRIVNLLRDP